MWLEDVPVARSHFSRIAQLTLGDWSIKTNPRPVGTAEHVEEILELAFQPRQLGAGLIETAGGDALSWRVGACVVTRILEMETIGVLHLAEFAFSRRQVDIVTISCFRLSHWTSCRSVIVLLAKHQSGRVLLLCRIPVSY